MTLSTAKFIFISILSLLIIYGILHFILHKLGQDRRNILPRNLVHRVKFPVIIFLVGVALQIGLSRDGFIRDESYHAFFDQLRALLYILSFTWLIIAFIRILKKRIALRHDINMVDNLRARKLMTQINILERIIIAIVLVFAIGIALLTFDGIREVGVSILTSAGIAGIILGLSAQKVIGTLLAGIQIALTQPIRIDDVVIVEGEWGRIEEIRLTYVVVNIWDKRRLVVPTTYFIENTFQNWTRNSSDILGTVFLYTDYSVPIDKLRQEFTSLLESTDLWDGKVNVIQVTDTTEKTLEIRALMSAKDSPTAWDLRVYIREKLVEFLQENYPSSLPTARLAVNQSLHQQD